MTVLVLATFKADRAEFERVHRERPDDFRSVAKDAQAAGCMHHRFAFGADGTTMLVLDEWPSAEAFEKFFAHPIVASLMEDAKVAAPPEVTVYEAADTVDQM